MLKVHSEQVGWHNRLFLFQINYMFPQLLLLLRANDRLSLEAEHPNDMIVNQKFALQLET